MNRILTCYYSNNVQASNVSWYPCRYLAAKQLCFCRWCQFAINALQAVYLSSGRQSQQRSGRTDSPQHTALDNQAAISTALNCPAVHIQGPAPGAKQCFQPLHACQAVSHQCCRCLHMRVRASSSRLLQLANIAHTITCQIAGFAKSQMRHQPVTAAAL